MCGKQDYLFKITIAVSHNQSFRISSAVAMQSLLLAVVCRRLADVGVLDHVPSGNPVLHAVCQLLKVGVHLGQLGLDLWPKPPSLLCLAAFWNHVYVFLHP